LPTYDLPFYLSINLFLIWVANIHLLFDLQMFITNI
jgi:hypothetical protein